MKHKFLLRVLGVFSTLALLIAALPLAPVSAAASIILSPNSGPAGSTVTISGTSTASPDGTQIQIYLNTIAVGTAYVTSHNIAGSFTVPSNLTRGTYQVSFVFLGNADTAASQTFTITPSITMASATGYVGDSVAVTGSGFTPSTTVNFYLSGSTTPFATTSSSSTGTISTTITIPAAKKGTLSITANDGGTPGTAPVNFIINPKITLSSSSPGVGDSITITGTGFYDGAVQIAIDSGAAVNAGVSVGSNGSFTATYEIPALTRGSHTLKVNDAWNNNAQVTFDIAQKITLTPNTGNVGTSVTVRGSGFNTTGTITLTYFGQSVTVTLSNGTFTTTFVIPGVQAGAYTISATDGSVTSTATLTVTTNITMSPTNNASTPGNVGQEITINGSGLKANDTVLVTFDSAQVTITPSPIVDSNGDFSLKFNVPATTAGPHTITVISGTTSKTFTFFVEGTAPATPAPLPPKWGLRLSNRWSLTGMT
jgi:IPT/TIG domain.